MGFQWGSEGKTMQNLRLASIAAKKQLRKPPRVSARPANDPQVSRRTYPCPWVAPGRFGYRLRVIWGDSGPDPRICQLCVQFCFINGKTHCSPVFVARQRFSTYSERTALTAASASLKAPSI